MHGLETSNQLIVMSSLVNYSSTVMDEQPSPTHGYHLCLHKIQQSRDEIGSNFFKNLDNNINNEFYGCVSKPPKQVYFYLTNTLSKGKALLCLV